MENLNNIHNLINNKYLIILNIIFEIISLFVFVFINFYYINKIPIIFTLFNSILLLAYLFFNFYSLYEATKLKIVTKKCRKL